MKDSAMRPPIDPRFNAFYLLTGVTFMSFASGFGVCLFNLDTVGDCIAVADSWVGVFTDMGNHLINWGIAMVHAAFRM